MKTKRLIALLVFITGLFPAFAQPVCTPWGNIKGLHVEGEKMDFETSLRSVNTGWKSYVKSEKYHWEGTQTYTIDDKSHFVSHYLLGTPIEYQCRMTETGEGKVKSELVIKATGNHDQAGTYFCFEVPGSDFTDGTIEFYLKNKKAGELQLSSAIKGIDGTFAALKADRVVWKSAHRNYVIAAGEAVRVFLRQDFDSNPAYRNDPWPQQSFAENDPLLKKANFQLYFTLIEGKAKKGTEKRFSFNIEASGTIDREPVTLVINPANPGRKWDGISGNYRFQFPEKDPMVIDYCLDSLRVTLSRISMWWEMWHAEEHSNPAELARAGQLPPRFYEQMELAKKLQQRNIPVIVSVWSAPGWAIDKNNIPRKGVHLDQSKMEAICESISGFLLYLKQDYGVEATLFSFNETDCGVEVFQTPEEHAIFNKAIGKHLKEKGLSTKMLLGDTGHGTAVANQIVWPSINDPSIHNYLGAIAFHTYHGCTNTDLQAWAKSAEAINLPIMVTEGGTNSAAHRYPLVFLQPWFQLEEIDTYIRICNLCQPSTIMEWQLTSDYSVLTGKGLYGDNGPLRPTQRFWNLKQLGNTPAGSFWLPVSCDRPGISCAAAAHIAQNRWSIHLVNNGAARTITIEGIPDTAKTFDVYLTDALHGMQRMETVSVKDGKLQFVAAKQAYYSLFSR